MNFSQYIKSLRGNILVIEESWGELFSRAFSKECHFADIRDLVSFVHNAGEFERYVNRLTEYAENLERFEKLIRAQNTELGETVFDMAISMAFIMKSLKEAFERARMSDEAREWISFVTNEIRSTLFNIMRDSQELIMGE